MNRLSPIFAALFVLNTMFCSASGQDKPLRSVEGLQLLYNFEGASGAVIEDRSGLEPSVNLEIGKPDSGAVVHENGILKIEQAPLIRLGGKDSADRLVAAVQKSNAITLEAWLTPANTKQEGPARILTLSKNSSERNFTLGQEGNRYVVRLRTTKTGRNGTNAVVESSKGSASEKSTHVVYTRSAKGVAMLFIDGDVSGEQKVEGTMENWEAGFPLAIGDEMSGQRPWLGVLQLIAVYDRDLSTMEVKTHFHAGPEASSSPDDAQRKEVDKLTVNRHLFEKKVAPLLAEHCLECHDTGTREGKLDLSRREKKHSADGIIIAGNFADSLLWEEIESDSMPEDRDPLSKEDKEILRQWIEGGAEWPIEVIDPAVYAHATAEKQQDRWVRRLTVDEYVETVRATTGIDVEESAGKLLPEDLRADGFSNTAYNLSVDLKHVEAYARLAGEIVEQLDTGEFAKRFNKSRSVADDDNMEELVQKMGRWLLRGPLDKEEVFAFRGIMTTVASAGGDFDEAVSFVVEAMLQSPRFLYRVEDQLGNGGVWPVDDFELASRLSYLVWGGPPDEQLLSLADKGELGSEKALRTQMERMLKDSRAETHSLRFAADWLHLDRLRSLQPDPKQFPKWKPALATDMREETLAFFRELVWKEKQPLKSLLNAQFTFVTPDLAEHYRLPQGAVDRSAAMQRVALADVDGRGGLLTQGSVLTMGGDNASMVTRGLFVFHDLLRGVVKNPPAGLNVSPVPTKPGLSHRVVAEQRLENQNCGGCHEKFEPLAFGLEKFDGLGTWQDIDPHGNSLREDGEVRIPGEAKPRSYQSVAELMDVLAQSDRVASSLTWKLVQYGLGRRLTPEDASHVDAVHRAAVKKDGGTYQSILSELASSDLIRKNSKVGSN